MDERIRRGRESLKDTLRLEYDFRQTDQRRNVAIPPLHKPAEEGLERIALPGPDAWPADFARIDLRDAIARRQSHRKYTDEALSQRELGFLLWSTQGVHQVIREGVARRTVPSAGARHAFETYIVLRNVKGLEPGLYRYLPVDHELLHLGALQNIAASMSEATLGQEFCGRMAATFVWSCIPYRMEWRYGPTAHRVILMDAGHVCQNLYLACEAIGCGTCAVAAYNQHKLDALLGLDGMDEFAVYLAPVGKL